MSESENNPEIESEIQKLIELKKEEVGDITPDKIGKDKTSDDKLDNIDVSKTKELEYEYESLLDEEGEQEGGLDLEG